MKEGEKRVKLLTEEERIEKLLLFEKSIGKRFKVEARPYKPLIDEVEGVDWEHEHVCGKRYGNFYVAYCELIEEEK